MLKTATQTKTDTQTGFFLMAAGHIFGTKPVPFSPSIYVPVCSFVATASTVIRVIRLAIKNNIACLCLSFEGDTRLKPSQISA